MAKTTDEDQDTINRLLESAQDVFAEEGFRDARIQDICERADANIASVNYHFGSKEDLYSQAWRKAFEESLEKYPPNGDVPDDAPAEERLRGRIRSLIERISDPDHQDFLFAHKEMANPTPLGGKVLKECIQPLVNGTIDLLRELLGPDVSEQTVEYCERSIVSQCLHLLHLQRKEEMIAESDADLDPEFPTIDDVDSYADHVYRFSLAGIRSIREQTYSQHISNDS
jgi:AcrR family transcriptional regulator